MVEYKSDALAATYAALGHPVRVELVGALRGREMRVTELARPFAISLAAVSKHIALLEAAGVVARRVAGREHWIRLADAALDDAVAWLDGAAPFWSDRLTALEAVLGQHAAAGAGMDRSA